MAPVGSGRSCGEWPDGTTARLSRTKATKLLLSRSGESTLPSRMTTLIRTMDLFAAAGMELEKGRRGAGRTAPSAPRTARIPLFKPSVIQRVLDLFGEPSRDQARIAAAYARKARSARFAAQKETAVRELFIGEVLIGVLGYAAFDPDKAYSLAREWPIRRGAVDVALGRFADDGSAEVVAPFELKGPGTSDLDAIVPGRGRSPVQQAWDYAIDAPGSRWVLVSNCVEIRLYGFGRGRDAYETFDLRRIDEASELERLCVVLSADRLLGDETDRLLRDSDSEFKAITGELYVQYSALRSKLIQFLVDAADGPELSLADAIEVAQKLLDRILFIAFAERTRLLPDRLLHRAATTQNEFAPQPVWQNFLALFRHVDQGEGKLYIPAYNGGLFATDPIADRIVLPDSLADDLAGLAAWDYGTDIPVTILGHIFEQSITDIEALRAESARLPPPAVSKRKRHGIVYTPDVATRFLVEHTIGVTLAEHFSALLKNHADTDVPPDNGDPLPWRDGEASECAFWRDYLSVLRALRIVDPACGSGAFLVAAFDLLAAEYRRVIQRLVGLGETPGFDLFDEILSRNLHGVDLNPESVEITRLSLWLKSARREHRLQNLETTIKVGNSLIDDPSFTDHPFDWQAEFPEVFAAGGFDVVIGNPPYVRMELVKPVKPYLEKHYVVAADRADLYAYFFERGVRILKQGGRLGYISSSTFFRTGSGENLRRFLGDGVAVEAVIDFGDFQLFEGVTTYPAIVTLRKGAAADGALSFLKIGGDLPKDLGAAFDAQKQTMPRARLTASSWRFEEEPLARLRDKIVKGRKTLGEVYGPPLYGIKTGFNDAFIIDTETRDRLVAADPKSEELLKPFLRGEDIKRWRVEPEGLFLINTPKGKVDIEAYPAIRDWLLPFKAELEQRATKQAWFELQQAQLAYQPAMGQPKIVYLDIAAEPPFAFDPKGTLIDCTVFMIPTSDLAVLSYLNSRVAWFQWIGETPIARGGYIRLKRQYLSPTAIPETTANLALLGESASASAIRRLEFLSNVRHRILDLRPALLQRDLTGRLHDWWELDFDAFRAEIGRAFSTDIPVSQRDDWERYLAENAAEVRTLSTTIADAEREIDAIVYRLFDLTADEITLLESSLAAR